jgi:hypothetical protein
MKKTVAVFIGILLSAGLAGAEVLYQQPFDNSEASNQPLTNVNWNANHSSAGTAYTGANGGIAPILSVGDYIYYKPTGANIDTPWLAWTDEADFGWISNMTNVSIRMANESAAEDIQIALKVDGAWYVSQDALNSTAWANTLSLAVQSVSWNSLAFIPGSSLVEGGAVSLPASGTVEAVGAFDASASTNKLRLDDFTIEGLPTPAVVTIYQQTFDNPVVGDQPLTNVNWNANHTSVGTTYTGFSGGVAPVLSISDFIYYLPTGANIDTPWLAWTDEAAFGAINDMARVSIKLTNVSAAEDIKIALKVDGAWYVSQDVLNSTSGETLSLWVQFVSWNSLAFTPDSSLVEGGVVSLPSSGTVQAVGAFDASASTNKMKLDNFTVEAIEQAAPYSIWTDSHSLSGSDAGMDADPDVDTMNNLVEYALGGNPTNSDAAAILPVAVLSAAGGTNWLDYVYHRRLDAESRGLTYEVLRNDDLVSGVWTNSGIIDGGSAVLDAEFEAVTNRIQTGTEPQQFLKLNIGFE